MKLNPKNEIERMIVRMIENGEHLHGLAREVLIEMMLREEE